MGHSKAVPWRQPPAAPSEVLTPARLWIVKGNTATARRQREDAAISTQDPILPWPFTREPARGAYRALIALAGARCSICGLILRNGSLAPRGDAVLARLAPFLIADERVSAWPGTEMRGGYTCRQLRYRVTPDLLPCLSESVDRLYGWLVELPEDLHFLRSGGEVWLESIAHERLGLLWLSRGERASLAIEAPALDRVLSREPLSD